MKALDFWLNLIMPPRLGVAAAAVAATAVSAAAGAAGSMAQSDAAGKAMDAETAQQLNGMEAAARSNVQANTYLNPYSGVGQAGNFALGNELGITPGMPIKPNRKDFQYIDPRTGQPVVNEMAWRQANNQYDAQLRSAAQYGSLNLNGQMPSIDQYRNKKGKVNEKAYAKALKDWNDTTKRAASAAGLDQMYSKAPDRKQFMEPVRNKKGKIVRNPDGTVKKAINEQKYNAALSDYQSKLGNAAQTYQQNYAGSNESKARGQLLKEYGAEDYAKDPLRYSTNLSMEGFKKDPGYAPMVYDEASWQQANDPGYLAKKDIITNDAQWKASGDPTYMAPVNTLADLQKTPGYMFGLNQGLDSAQTSAAAGGSLMSGATLKALSDYGSGYASQKWMDYANMQADRFNQAFNRSFNYDQARASRFNDAFQRGQGAYLNYFNRANSAYQNAFNRNMQNKQFRLGALEQQQNVGLNSASQQSHNTMQTGAQTQQGYQNIGNAQAQGALNQGQAMSNMYTGVGNAISSGIGNAVFLNQVGNGNPNANTTRTG